ncbi:hypothetical protein G9A89_010611 [Geosiphon pyriformis]|nr:hypothetical protein G9A89_010611 [Geosiphon pyriformis]
MSSTSPQSTIPVITITCPDDLPLNRDQNLALDNTLSNVTIIDNDKKDLTLFKQQKTCGCLKERTIVNVILLMYLILGILKTFSYISELVFTHSLQEQVLYILSGIITTVIAVTAALGLRTLYKENARLLHHLAIVFAVLNFLLLILGLIEFTFDINSRKTLIHNCKKHSKEFIHSKESNHVDCNHVVNIFLLKEGLNLFFQVVQIYFAYIIYCYANRMNDKMGCPYPLTNTPEEELSPTYFVYGSRGVPTADNWIPPPPSYDGNIRIDDEKFVDLTKSV